jgi:putative membrane protein
LITFNPSAIERPDKSLLKYYVLMSLLTGPGIVVMFLPLFFKYETLRYKFEDDAMSMSWGILFRHEIHLTYRRIQDIHLTAISSNVGLACRHFPFRPHPAARRRK